MAEVKRDSKGTSKPMPCSRACRSRGVYGGVVGQHQKGDARPLEPPDELIGTRHRGGTPDQDAVHVAQICLGHHHAFRLSSAARMRRRSVSIGTHQAKPRTLRRRLARPSSDRRSDAQQQNAPIRQGVGGMDVAALRGAPKAAPWFRADRRAVGPRPGRSADALVTIDPQVDHARARVVEERAVSNTHNALSGDGGRGSGRRAVGRACM